MIRTPALLPGPPAAAHADVVPVECRSGAPRVRLAADPDATQAAVILTLPVGAADETEAERGVAHFVEHLTFRGRKAEAGQATSTGAGIDGFGNAYTGPWATTQHWTVPPGRAAEAVTRALAVLGPLDASEAAAAQEQEIVAREREQREDGAVARDTLAMDAALFSGTPLARSVIGTAAEIAALDLATARAFHDRLYDPSVAVLILAGAVDWTLVDGLTGGDAMPRRLPALDIAPAGPAPMTREDVVQRPERWGIWLAEAPEGDAVLAALTVADAFLASALPGAPGPALVRGRVDLRDGWASAYGVVPGVIALAAGVVLRPGLAPEDLDAPWAAWGDLWDALARNGLDAATVTRLRDRLVRDEARARSDAIAAGWSLVPWFEMGRTAEDWAAWPDVLASVTAEDVASALRLLDAPPPLRHARHASAATSAAQAKD